MDTKGQIQPYTIYDLVDTSNFLNVDRKTTYQLIKNGELPARKLGRGYKVLGEHILNFMGSPSIARMQTTFTTPSNAGQVSPENLPKQESPFDNAGVIVFDPTKIK